MTLHYQDDWLTVLHGDVRDELRTLPDESVHCVVTSPPYWGLRDYGQPDQLGLEPTPEQYVENMVAVFREVRRVLRSDGTLWLNLGDSYATSAAGNKTPSGISQATPKRDGRLDEYNSVTRDWQALGLKPKDLVGIPWRVAFALQQPYYVGTIRDERDRIWLAAMLDAEGCLFIHKRKAGQHNGQGYYRTHDNYGPGVEIANTSLAVVERIMALVGKGSISTQGPDETGGRRKQTIYRWNLRTTECRDFVRELYPYLVAKQQQARILIGCPSSGERAEAAHAGLKALHRTGVSDVDFPAPASMLEPGWYLRSDVIWSKANPMPESVTDRPTKSHEYLFLLSKSARYYFDADAVREANQNQGATDAGYLTDWQVRPNNGAVDGKGLGGYRMGSVESGRNIRSVWTIATAPYPGAHFATFPPKLVEPCIKAGTSEKGVCPECGAPWERVVERPDPTLPAAKGPKGREYGTSDVDRRSSFHVAGWRKAEPDVPTTTGWRPSCGHGGWFPDDGAIANGQIFLPQPIPATVLDPFAGSGTTGMVAQSLSRRAVLIDLNVDYLGQLMERNRAIPLGLTEPAA